MAELTLTLRPACNDYIEIGVPGLPAGLDRRGSGTVAPELFKEAA
jgi:hypothetical protein